MSFEAGFILGAVSVLLLVGIGYLAYAWRQKALSQEAIDALVAKATSSTERVTGSTSKVADASSVAAGIEPTPPTPGGN